MSKATPWLCLNSHAKEREVLCGAGVGARLYGSKELMALSDGYRESSEGWAELLRDLKKRGMKAPELAVGDGALGFWSAIRDVFPETHHQLDFSPQNQKRPRLDAQESPLSGEGGHRRDHRGREQGRAEKASMAFASEFGVKWPKAVAKIVDDREALLTFYDYPAAHWRHLRTTNPIEAVFAPVRTRIGLTKEPSSQQAALAMIFKLMEVAEGRWRKLSGAQMVAVVRSGVEFRNGELVERSEGKDEGKDAA